MLDLRFTTVLDSRKTGLVVKPDVLKNDGKRFGFDRPPCLGGSELGSPPKRNAGLSPFILDELLAAGKQIQDGQLKNYAELGTKLKETDRDPDLLRPWEDIQRALHALQLSPTLSEEILLLEGHVKEIYRGWGKIWSQSRSSQTSYRNKEQIKQARKMQQMQLMDLARQYMQTPSGCQILQIFSNIEKLKASCAYSLSPRLARNVAFQALCKIKAEIHGSTAFTTEFGEAMSMSPAEVRVRSQFNTQIED